MLVWLEYQTKVIGMDGKPLVLSVEASIKADRIQAMLVWNDEIADHITDFTPFGGLAEIDKAIWAEVDRRERSEALALKACVPMPGHSSQFVSWINARSC
jgi:hypothetical protein